MTPPPAATPPAVTGMYPSVGLASSSRSPIAATVGGNRCGHRPAAPRFHLVKLPEGSNPARPLLIGKLCTAIPTYYHQPQAHCWEGLSQSERRQRLERRLEKPEKPGKKKGRRSRRHRTEWRQQRSERREAIVSLLLLLFCYTDIRTRLIGIPCGADWHGLSTAWIGAHTGLSASRVKRALATLTHADWITNTGRGRHYDRQRRRWVGIGWGPIRQLSYHCIRALGLEVSWSQAQRRARKAAQRQARAQAPTAPSTPNAASATTPEQRERQRAHLHTLRQHLASPGARQAAEDPHGHQATIARNRHIAELLRQGLTPAQIRQQLDHLPQPP